jgi:hypothetical protein
MVDVVRESRVRTGMDSALSGCRLFGGYLEQRYIQRNTTVFRLAPSLIVSYYWLTAVYAKSDMSWRRRAARDFKAALDREET